MFIYTYAANVLEKKWNETIASITIKHCSRDGTAVRKFDSKSQDYEFDSLLVLQIPQMQYVEKAVLCSF